MTSASPPRVRWIWPALAALVALLPFVQGLSNSRVFYVRDLSSYFWGRYLWLRRAWFAGEWPLWDPYVGAGQAAYSDALHQMFLPPAVLVRMIGGEVLGFNLWVLLPFPIAAAGAWLFLVRHSTATAAALGAIAFSACGPVVSAGNFPNLSWSVAALPWALWATDRLAARHSRRDFVLLAVLIALQCVAGEPVTLFTTLALLPAYAVAVGSPTGVDTWASRIRLVILIGASSALGLALSAIQLIPMTMAARLADRSDTIVADAWSLRPTALLETVWIHLFGDYFETQTLGDVPWMPLMYTDREPLLFSIYFGVPLLALAVVGLGGTAPRRWRLFWVAAGLISIVASFGSYTPIYPILRDHVPPFGSFRFPVKYIVVAAMAVAAGAASGWDELTFWSGRHLDAWNQRRARRARLVAFGIAATISVLVALFAAACVFLPDLVTGPLEAFARAHGTPETDDHAAFMLSTVPIGAVPVVLLSAAIALLVLVTTSGESRAAAAGRVVLALVIVGDVVVRASGVNPAFDAKFFDEPSWLAYAREHPDTRVYVGGKVGGTLNSSDIDASRGFLNAHGLTGSASRAALSIQAAYYPSAWGVREMLSYDLPVLWPHAFTAMMKRFYETGADERDRLLDRTGVRYRVLPQRRAGHRTPIVPIPQFYESFLYDWGPGVAPRVSVVEKARIVVEEKEQVDALFEDGWDARGETLIDRELAPAGAAGTPVEPFARFTDDGANRVVIEAGAGAGGGYLVLLDTYSEDWRVTVNRQPAEFARANGLFRAVRLAEGRHTIEFVYRPPAQMWGTWISIAAAIVLAAIAMSGKIQLSE